MRNAAALLLLGTGLATALALAAPLGWPFELFAHFRGQLAAAAFVLVPVLAWQRRARDAMLAAALTLIHLLPVLGQVRADHTAPCTGRVLTVVTANLHVRNADTGRFGQWLEANPADLVVVQEVSPTSAETLARLPGYPYKTVLARRDPYGIAVLSRWPMTGIRQVELAGDGLPSLLGRMDADGDGLTFLGLHTRWPVVPRLARLRDESLQAAARHVRAQAGPSVVLGDLNLTPYSPVFARFTEAAGLRDAMDGRRWRPTWMAGFWPLALRIDHVLVSPGVCVESAEVGPSIGSDHRPVIARLRLASAAAD